MIIIEKLCCNRKKVKLQIDKPNWKIIIKPSWNQSYKNQDELPHRALAKGLLTKCAIHKNTA